MHRLRPRGGASGVSSGRPGVREVRDARAQPDQGTSFDATFAPRGRCPLRYRTSKRHSRRSNALSKWAGGARTHDRRIMSGVGDPVDHADELGESAVRSSTSTTRGRIGDTGTTGAAGLPLGPAATARASSWRAGSGVPTGRSAPGPARRTWPRCSRGWCSGTAPHSAARRPHGTPPARPTVSAGTGRAPAGVGVWPAGQSRTSSGILVSLAAGLGVVLQRYLLRMFLWRYKQAPLRWIRWLDWVTHRRLLYWAAGGGYVFIHPSYRTTSLRQALETKVPRL
jgi:hypothetical protein